MIPCGVRPAVLLTFALLLVGSACSPDDVSNKPVGYTNPSSGPQPGVRRAVALEEPDQVAERGRLLFDMERALDMGLQRGLPAAGNIRNEIMLPIVDVDAGGLSGQEGVSGT